jgi:hypothetical protein
LLVVAVVVKVVVVLVVFYKELSLQYHPQFQ